MCCNDRTHVIVISSVWMVLTGISAIWSLIWTVGTYTSGASNLSVVSKTFGGHLLSCCWNQSGNPHYLDNSRNPKYCWGSQEQKMAFGTCYDLLGPPNCSLYWSFNILWLIASLHQSAAHCTWNQLLLCIDCYKTSH